MNNYVNNCKIIFSLLKKEYRHCLVKSLYCSIKLLCKESAKNKTDHNIKNSIHAYQPFLSRRKCLHKPVFY